MTSPSTRAAHAFAWPSALAVVLLALNLRPGATSVGPVLRELQADLLLSDTLAGVLTALPGLCFAAFGATAVWLAVRLSVGGALTLGAAVIALSLGARSFVGDAAAFLLLSIAAFAGMAVGNVLLPSFVKRRFPQRTAAMMSVYATTLALGATLASLVAAPIAASMPGGWRASVGLWGVMALLAVAVWIPIALRERRRRHTAGHSTHPGSIWAMARSPKAVALGLFFGVQSMQAYVQFGWIAEIFRDAGVAATAAGSLASLIAALGIPAGLAMPVVLARVADARPLPLLFAALLVAGYVGVLVAPLAAPWLWALLLGLSGAAFPTALALMTARSRDPHVTAQLSGFSQAVGYLIAGIGPFAVGALHDLSGGWTVPLIALAVSSLVMAAAGWVAADAGYVDDQLAR